MGDWSLNIGLGVWGRAFGGVSLSEDAPALGSGGVELSPGFVGPAVLDTGRGTHALDVYESVEIAPVLFIGSRRSGDGASAMLTGGASLQVRVPIPVDTGSAIIHPVAPYASIGVTSGDGEPGSPGVDLRLSAGADFALYESTLGSVGLNVNYSLISDDEHAIMAGVSGTFDLIGELRTSTF